MDQMQVTRIEPRVRGKIRRKKRVLEKKKKLISKGMPNENMLQYVSKRHFQCEMMISSAAFLTSYPDFVNF